MTNTASRKASYSRPELTVFGSVRNLTGGSVGSMSDGSGTLTLAMGMISDPRAKENIVQVGTHPAGFGLYLFDYKAEFLAEGGEGRKFGVMADEVRAIVPEAVLTDASGYMRVDYAKLGITLN
jgi:hypothetical protein